MKSLKKSLNLLFLAVFLWIGGFVINVDSALNMKIDAPGEVTDAIVVLTGGDKRIETGLGLLAEKQSKYLFISGVHPNVKDSEIRHIWTGDLELPECCLILGQRATTTTQNAEETKEWVEENDIKTIRLVTADYHMPRAWLELTHAMPDITILVNPVKQPNLGVKTPLFWVLMFTEYHKSLVRGVMLATNIEKYIGKL